jgi:hypothetical protein
LGETFQRAAQGVGGQAHALVVDGHGDEGAFGEVDDWPRGCSKVAEDALESPSGAVVVAEDDQRIIGLLQDERREPVHDGVTEHAVALDHALQDISATRRKR